MPSSILNSDDGVISGTSGLKSSGGDDGALAVQSNGTEVAKFKTTELVINDGGANYDFRVEGDNQANLLFVDASTDRVGLGTNTPAERLDVAGNANIGNAAISGATVNIIASTASQIYGYIGATLTGSFGYVDATQMIVGSQTSIPYIMRTNGTERLSLSATGFLLHTPGTSNTAGTGLLRIAPSGGNGVLNVQYTTRGDGSANQANSGIIMGADNSTSRSINAAGTLNANGTDYAEYMTKAGNFEIAKGDVCGINSDGKLTNIFADAIAFVVKSTDPSFIGGNGWGAENKIGKKPVEPTKRSAEVDEEGNETQAAETDEDFAARMVQYESDLAEFEAKLETERQKVDRIAFSGQVPVNVTGATAGQYIVPVESNGGITGIAVNEADMTLTQYIKSVGKVIAAEEDGRARIIVKVA